MSLASLLVGMLCCLWPAAPQEVPESQVTLDLQIPAAPLFEHQTIPVQVRITLATRFVEENLVQLFPQPLDLPLELRVPWLQGPDGPTGGGMSLVFNDRIVAATPREETDPEGERLTVLEFPLSLSVSQAGSLVLSGARLRYAYATRFTVDFYGDRMPEDRQEVEVAPDDVTLEILPLPEADRPEGFCGAVGDWTVRASAEVDGLVAGDAFDLHLHVEGQGNLHDFQAPSLPPMAGLTVRGLLDQHGDDWREFVYDVVWQDGQVAAIPALPFVSFDPRPPAAYRTVHTEPIALPVVVTTQSPDPDATSRIPPALLILGIVAPLALGLWVFGRPRRSQTARGSGPASQADAGGDACRRRLETQPGREDEALASYLAHRLRVPPAAVIQPDLAGLLEQSGVESAPARQAADLLLALTAARYGGEPVPQAAAQVRAVVELLESQSTELPGTARPGLAVRRDRP